jgi:hypothetical protein
LFIGVRDNGEIDPNSQNLDAVQKTLAEVLNVTCPRIPYFTKGLKEGELSYLAVIVHGSANRPHFAGPAYIRTGSKTVDASEDQFRELVAQRLSKVRELLKWTSKEISVETRITLAGLDSIAGRTRESAVLTGCNEFYVTLLSEGVTSKDYRRSIPLARLEISYDDEHDRLLIETEG